MIGVHSQVKYNWGLSQKFKKRNHAHHIQSWYKSTSKIFCYIISISQSICILIFDGTRIGIYFKFASFKRKLWIKVNAAISKIGRVAPISMWTSSNKEISHKEDYVWLRKKVYQQYSCWVGFDRMNLSCLEMPKVWVTHFAQCTQRANLGQVKLACLAQFQGSCRVLCGRVFVQILAKACHSLHQISPVVGFWQGTSNHLPASSGFVPKSLSHLHIKMFSVKYNSQGSISIDKYFTVTELMWLRL